MIFMATRQSADLRDHQGLMVFVATRLGEAFCTRSGLALEPCAQLWVRWPGNGRSATKRWGTFKKNAGFMVVEC